MIARILNRSNVQLKRLRINVPISLLSTDKPNIENLKGIVLLTDIVRSIVNVALLHKVASENTITLPFWDQHSDLYFAAPTSNQ